MKQTRNEKKKKKETKKDKGPRGNVSAQRQKRPTA
jgi:hypothetical protein